jgi:3-hydroxybutyryl-CoA dehydrogenase
MEETASRVGGRYSRGRGVRSHEEWKLVLFIDTVGVVGAGTMGSQIAEVFALNGKNVVLSDVKDEFVQKGLQRIRASLDGLAAFHEGKAEREIQQAESTLGIQLSSEQKDAARKRIRPTYTKQRVAEAFGRIKGTTKLEDMAKCELVIEAVLEEKKVKADVFQRLNTILDSRAIVATNTSSLSVSDLAATSGRPKRFLGLHFFNPPTTLPLIEVIPGTDSDPEAVEDIVNLVAGLRNHRYPMMPVVVKDAPGFLVNRILGALLKEAYAALEENIASARDIDKAMKAGAGLPMGPLELSDHIGLDVIYHAGKVIEAAEGRYPFVKKPAVLEKLVKEGRLGKKSGSGFFQHT